MTRECSINDCRHTVISDDFYRRDAANQHSRDGIPHKSQTFLKCKLFNIGGIWDTLGGGRSGIFIVAAFLNDKINCFWYITNIGLL